jgi:DNA-binding transcriptional ArsR family regulator
MNNLELDADIITRLTRLFSAVADTTRIRIILLIMDRERRSTDIALALDMTTSAVSHQLRWLRERRIVSARRQGREIHYQLADQCVHELIAIALQHVQETE